MVNLFSKKKSHYNGFAKYNDEYTKPQTASTSAQRTQSLTSASQAAMAALHMHSKPASPQMQTNSRSSLRANSFGSYQRANSMQSYTYTPKASYVAGSRGSGPSGSHRSYSLRSNPRSESRCSSLSGSIRSVPRRHMAARLSQFPEEQEDEFAGFDDNNEENEVITTKTTKIVDASGRTKSITTETIRTLPDGSNIIETKTTNISRPGSRTNSLKNATLPVHQANPNLRKIEEDLSDFDSTYLDMKRHDEVSSNLLHSPSGEVNSQPNQVNSQPNQVNSQPNQVNSQPNQVNSQPNHLDSQPNHLDSQPNHLDSQLNSQTNSEINSQLNLPQLNPQPNPLSLNLLESPARIRDASPNGRANSITSSQSGRRLKSILKNNSAAAAFRVSEGSPVSNDVSPLKKDGSSPKALETSPAVAKSRRLSSMTSGANSIKFLETVETIPYAEPDSKELQREELLKKEQMKQENLDLYDKAMQVAMQRVYGPNSQGSVAPTASDAPKPHDLDTFAEKKSEKKLKTDVKRSKVEAAGVSPNYIYENHHKEFHMHSMRSGHSSTRKERLKEEKKRLKEEEKRLKEEEKRREQLVKSAEKEHGGQEKKKKKSPFTIFKKHKRKGSISENSVYSSDPSNFSSVQEARIPEPNDSEHAKSSSKMVTGSSNTNAPEASSIFSVQDAGSPKISVSEASGNKEVSSPNSSAQKVVSSAGQSETLPLPVFNVSEETDSFSEVDNDEFVDVPENLDEAADKRLSTIPVMENETPKNSILGEPISLQPSAIPTNARSENEDYPILVSGKDGKPQVLSETSNVVSQRTNNEFSSNKESSSTNESQTNRKSQPETNSTTNVKKEFLDNSLEDQGLKSSGQVNNTLTQEKSRELVIDDENSRELVIDEENSRGLVIDEENSREAPVIDEENFREAPVIDEEKSRSAEPIEFSLPEKPLEPTTHESNSRIKESFQTSESQKQLLNSESQKKLLNSEKSSKKTHSNLTEEISNDHGVIEALSSNDQISKTKSNSSVEKEAETKTKNSKNSNDTSKHSRKDSKGGRFKRTIEKYFLTTYK